MSQQQVVVERVPANSRASQIGFLALALGLGGYIYWVRSDPNPPPTHPMPELVKGAEIDAPITLVAADKTDLACMHATEEEGFHCEYATTDKTWAETHQGPDATDRRKLLSPYKTIDDLLFFIPGLFEDPAVDERYKDEPSAKAPRDKQSRFTAQCKLKLLKEVESVMVRWHPKGGWQGPQKAWIGTVSSCQVSEP
jgi:hypothetical protein